MSRCTLCRSWRVCGQRGRIPTTTFYWYLKKITDPTRLLCSVELRSLLKNSVSNDIITRLPDAWWTASSSKRLKGGDEKWSWEMISDLWRYARCEQASRYNGFANIILLEEVQLSPQGSGITKRSMALLQIHFKRTLSEALEWWLFIMSNASFILHNSISWCSSSLLPFLLSNLGLNRVFLAWKINQLNLCI